MALLPLVVLIGACLRGFLYAIPSIPAALSSRPELVTPISSFYRLREGVFLYDSTGSPYSGDVYHQPPLLFAFLYPVFQVVPVSLQYLVICGIFISIDLLLGMGFARLCAKTLKLEEGRKFMIQGHETWLSQIPVSPLFTPENLPTTVAFIYLMNPYSLASSLAMSTVSLTHLAILYSLLFASEGALVASMMCVAMGTYLSVYPIFLMLPILLLLRSIETDKTVSSKTRGVGAKLAAKGLMIFTIWMSVLLYLSWSLNGGWGFLTETYVWVARYSDLTPNIGIFWYFFMEVFDRFIPYFLLVMHLHPVIYVVPIYLRLAHRPQAYACALIGLFSLFQAYPCFGDFGFFLSMMALHPKTIMSKCFNLCFDMTHDLVLTSTPCLIRLTLRSNRKSIRVRDWFGSRNVHAASSGNANFFYNQTLVYQIFHSQLITAFIGATMKRDKDVEKYRTRYLKELEKAKASEKNE
ncbi:hypothetical protein PsorP6_006592 [Peronosclerospora sorghi]|uniref:Uncharacterized protein n=1 Tax=Peronosclerospora sorghi TaxID=230839 RepID=A0ACC0W1P1_9STRA|nr:hypothetical protein PsorP6_006592 [Peronosclerospora sorghi]